ncbi:GntR domain protein [Desulfofundulus kuznetsovii DSM 6115]|uniref:GntR domain protein n=1 Tax=Desulfofundulus kuznetsovii (strain DSM 6115 / VKM B-1805 / 17) TaxID=760568 RepID=A0AAU8PGN6_DESK7|nr:GntR domain protein [Desulfofundulus kuznetsovii DSM 6115]
MFKKIEYRRLYEDVITQIENIILAGQLAPGDKLPPERELAEEIGVSRGTLREAFRILERQGIIETRPGGGRYVRKLPENRLDRERILSNLETAAMLDLLEAREALESKIIELACERATKADLEAIERALSIIEEGKAERYEVLDHDQAFHLAIAEATHNIVFVTICELYLDLLFKIRAKTTVMPGRAKQILEEHRAIFEAIKCRDTNGAKKALMDHLRNIKTSIKKAEGKEE